MPAPDFAIIGGGVVGLTIARELSRRHPRARIAVFEKEPHLGQHASGRNSGVLHAGFYYAPDSLKARLTARGNHLLRAFCAEHDVPVRSCGKVVVASSPDQLPALDELVRRGTANGVRLETVDERGLADLEPLAQTVERAIWSPDTGVADPRAVTAALQRDLTERGVTIRTSTPVTRPPDAGHVVNAAGLYADRVAQWYGFCDDYVMMPFKGLYWYGNDRAPRLQRHVYPVPDPRNPFLGVHFTVTPGGGVKVGPTAIPVLSREAYSWGLRADEAREVAAAFPAFLRGGHHDVPALIRSRGARSTAVAGSSGRRARWSPRPTASPSAASPASAPSSCTRPPAGWRWTSWCAATSAPPTCSTPSPRRGPRVWRSPNSWWTG